MAGFSKFIILIAIFGLLLSSSAISGQFISITATSDATSMATSENSAIQNTPTLNKINHPPSVDAGRDITIKENQRVVVDDVRSTDADGDELSFAWTQISPKKPKIDLNNDGRKGLSFVAPDVERDTVFKFLLVVRDENGADGRDQINVRVINVAEEGFPTGTSERSSIGSEQSITTDSSEFDDRIHAKRDQPSISATNPCSIATFVCNVNEGEPLSSGFTWGVVFISNGQLVPGLIAHVVMQSGPPGLQSSSVDGNPAIVNFKWDNPAPPGTYKAVFTLQILFCPAAHTKACNDFLNTRNHPISFMINVNGKPTADDQEISTEKNTELDITLSGSDPNGDKLSFKVLSQPAHGSLEGSAPALTYTPNQDYSGQDSFTFNVNDGKVDSDTATISIEVESSNREPTANAGADQEDVYEGDTVTLDGSGSTDPDGDDLTYAWTQVGSPLVKWLTPQEIVQPKFEVPKMTPVVGIASSGETPISTSDLSDVSLLFDLIVKDKQGAVSQPSRTKVGVCAKPPTWPTDVVSNEIDDIAKKAIKKIPLSSGEVLRLRAFYNSIELGGRLKGFPEASQLLNRYLTPSVTGLEHINPTIYQTSLNVQKEIKRQKSIIDADAKDGILKNGGKLSSTILFADIGNDRLKNANNRFILQSESVLQRDHSTVVTRFFVFDDYSFEPFAKCLYKGLYSDFPIPFGLGIVRVPDGLSHYLTTIGLAKDFNHIAEWRESWTITK